ncbi:hypothetical protein L6452_21534 [Arctium lappa]|uniref:Uncharacterized protein n=1 Tax=Arctium lappa TaxID=4217 RepID=A0ACB9AWF6_ARCLA|nr:hypothetical protein L6452_21534 [Arctium lappa]
MHSYTMSDYVCDALIAEVFERLPPKSIVRFIFLSKEWGSRIISPHFISKQCLQSTKSPQKFMFQHEVAIQGCPPEKFCTLHSEGQWPLCSVQGYVGIPRVDIPGGDRPMIVGSCNGVVCLYDSVEGGLILWNPTIRRKLSLPNHIIGMVGFGFDGATDDYKVVTISDTKNDRHERESLVYSLRTGTWRAIASSPTPFFSEEAFGCLVNGSLYWVVFRFVTETERHYFLLSFYLGNEVFSCIQLPETSWETRQVLSIKGSLGVVSIALENHHETSWIWMRRDESWSVVYKVKGLEPEAQILKVLPLTTNDDCLLNAYYEGFYICDLVTGVRSQFVEFGPRTRLIDMERYAESILLLDRGVDCR